MQRLDQEQDQYDSASMLEYDGRYGTADIAGQTAKKNSSIMRIWFTPLASQWIWVRFYEKDFDLHLQCCILMPFSYVSS